MSTENYSLNDKDFAQQELFLKTIFNNGEDILLVTFPRNKGGGSAKVFGNADADGRRRWITARNADMENIYYQIGNVIVPLDDEGFPLKECEYVTGKGSKRKTSIEPLPLCKKAKKETIHSIGVLFYDIDANKGYEVVGYEGSDETKAKKEAWIKRDDAEKRAFYKAEKLRCSELSRSAYQMGKVPKTSFMVDSGNGFHGYYLLKEPAVFVDDKNKQVQANVDLFESRLKQLIMETEADDKCFNLDRIFRVPGTWNYASDEKLQLGRIHVKCRLDPNVINYDEDVKSFVFINELEKHDIDKFPPLDVGGQETMLDETPPPAKEKRLSEEPQGARSKVDAEFGFSVPHGELEGRNGKMGACPSDNCGNPTGFIYKGNDKDGITLGCKSVSCKFHNPAKSSGCFSFAGIPKKKSNAGRKKNMVNVVLEWTDIHKKQMSAWKMDFKITEAYGVFPTERMFRSKKTPELNETNRPAIGMPIKRNGVMLDTEFRHIGDEKLISYHSKEKTNAKPYGVFGEDQMKEAVMAMPEGERVAVMCEGLKDVLSYATATGKMNAFSFVGGAIMYPDSDYLINQALLLKWFIKNDVKILFIGEDDIELEKAGKPNPGKLFREVIFNWRGYEDCLYIPDAGILCSESCEVKKENGDVKRKTCADISDILVMHGADAVKEWLASAVDAYDVPPPPFDEDAELEALRSGDKPDYPSGFAKIMLNRYPGLIMCFDPKKAIGTHAACDSLLVASEGSGKIEKTRLGFESEILNLAKSINLPAVYAMNVAKQTLALIERDDATSLIYNNEKDIDLNVILGALSRNELKFLKKNPSKKLKHLDSRGLYVGSHSREDGDPDSYRTRYGSSPLIIKPSNDFIGTRRLPFQIPENIPSFNELKKTVTWQKHILPWFSGDQLSIDRWFLLKASAIGGNKGRFFVIQIGPTGCGKSSLDKYLDYSFAGWVITLKQNVIISKKGHTANDHPTALVGLDTNFWALLDEAPTGYEYSIMGGAAKLISGGGKIGVRKCGDDFTDVFVMAQPGISCNEGEEIMPDETGTPILKRFHVVKFLESVDGDPNDLESEMKDGRANFFFIMCHYLRMYRELTQNVDRVLMTKQGKYHPFPDAPVHDEATRVYHGLADSLGTDLSDASYDGYVEDAFYTRDEWREELIKEHGSVYSEANFPARAFNAALSKIGAKGMGKFKQCDFNARQFHKGAGCRKSGIRGLEMLSVKQNEYEKELTEEQKIEKAKDELADKLRNEKFNYNKTWEHDRPVIATEGVPEPVCVKPDNYAQPALNAPLAKTEQEIAEDARKQKEFDDEEERKRIEHDLREF